MITKKKLVEGCSLSALVGAMTLITLGVLSLSIGGASSATNGTLLAASAVALALLAPQLRKASRTNRPVHA